MGDGTVIINNKRPQLCKVMEWNGWGVIAGCFILLPCLRHEVIM